MSLKPLVLTVGPCRQAPGVLERWHGPSAADRSHPSPPRCSGRRISAPSGPRTAMKTLQTKPNKKHSKPKRATVSATEILTAYSCPVADCDARGSREGLTRRFSMHRQQTAMERCSITPPFKVSSRLGQSTRIIILGAWFGHLTTLDKQRPFKKISNWSNAFVLVQIQQRLFRTMRRQALTSTTLTWERLPGKLLIRRSFQNTTYLAALRVLLIERTYCMMVHQRRGGIITFGAVGEVRRSSRAIHTVLK